MSPGALLISVSDKLQQVRQLRRQVGLLGDQAYAPFAKKEYPTIVERRGAVLWFHESLANAYLLRANELPIEPKLAGIFALIEDFVVVLEWMEKH